MNRISLHYLTKIATDIIDTEKQIKYLPDEQMSIVLENGDKRTIGEIDLHEDITDLKYLLDELLEHIANTAAEIHTNAVNERDGYPENSTAKRALWLDEVQDISSRLCSQIRDRNH